MFFLLTLIVIIASWVGDIYGLSIIFPQSGEEVRVQNLLNADGLRWMLQNFVTNFTGFTPLGMVVIAMFGLGIAQHSGFIDACIRRIIRNTRHEKQKVIITVIALGIISNLVGDAGYIILLPIAAALFASVSLNPVAGIVTAYVSVACGYSANIFLSIIDPVLSISTEKAAYLSGAWDMSTGPMCNFYFFFVSSFLIGIVIYIVTCRSLLPTIGREEYVFKTTDRKPLSHKERRALNLACVVGLIYLAFFIVASVLPSGLLRGVDGGLLYSPFTMNMLTILAVGFALMGIIYGVSSGRYHKDSDVVDGFISCIGLLGIYFVIAFFAAQLYACFSYSHLDQYIAFNMASLLTSLSFGKLPTLLFFIVLTAIVNLVLTSATGKWGFMAFIFVPYFIKMGISPDVTQCAFRIGDSATNAITPFLFYMPLVLTLMQSYSKKITYGTLFRYTWRYSVYILLAWMVLFVVWYISGLPFGR